MVKCRLAGTLADRIRGVVNIHGGAKVGDIGTMVYAAGSFNSGVELVSATPERP